MSKYIKADAIDIRAREGYSVDGVLYLPYRDVRKSLDSAPSIDIVRCKECRYYKQSEAFCENGNGLWQAGNECFCSYGEREGE